MNKRSIEKSLPSKPIVILVGWLLVVLKIKTLCCNDFIVELIVWHVLSRADTDRLFLSSFSLVIKVFKKD